MLLKIQRVYKKIMFQTTIHDLMLTLDKAQSIGAEAAQDRNVCPNTRLIFF